MASKDAFTLALSNLLSVQRECETLQKGLIEKFDQEFVWFEEIFEATCSAFTVKSNKLEQMPKTPSVKNKLQKRKRKKAEEIKIEEESTPTSSKPVSTKLTFEIGIENREDTEIALSTNTGRPMRRCRTSKNVAPAKAPPKQALSKQNKKQSDKASDEKNTSGTSLKSPLQESNNVNKANIGSACASTPEVPPSDTKKNTPKITLAETSEDSSPSVKARAKAYEVMLERLTPNSQCSSKANPSKILTPPAAAPPATHNGTNSKCHQSLVSPASTPKSSSHAKIAKKARQSLNNVEKESAKDSPAPRPVKTRLRLNKQQAIEPTRDESSGSSPGPKKSIDNKAHSSETAPTSSSECIMDVGDVDMFDSSLNSQQTTIASSTRQSPNETHVVISEIYEYQGADSQEAKLLSYEVTKTKTTPVPNISTSENGNPPLLRNKSFTISVNKTGGDSCESVKDNPSKISGSDNDEDASTGMSTRTRTRARVNAENAKTTKNKDSGVHTRMSGENANSTFTADSDSGSDEGVGRSTRTRARQQKEETSSSEEAGGAVRSTRTRQRAQEKAAAVKSIVVEGIQQGSQKDHEDIPIDRKNESSNPAAKLLAHKNDEEISGSPAGQTVRSSLRGAKRLVDHGRGVSPAPKRARSIIGDELADARPLSTSSPIKNHEDSEARDQVLSVSKPYKFSMAQRNTSGIMNRTPGFSHNQSKVISFLNTPTSGHHANSAMRSFLKKTSPSPQPTSQLLHEQKKKKLLEKQKRDAEKVNKTQEERKRKAEERQRIREERFQKAAALRHEQEERQRQMEERVRKKLGNTALLKEKIKEEREKEEAEKRKQRQQKQIEADLRRKQEEEEKIRKRLEQEEEARQLEEQFQKKRKQEEQLRKQRIAEEKQRKEERMADKEQKLQEERAKILQLQKEKELMMEQTRSQIENRLLQERMERERIEKEKRLEKEKKLREDMEKLKAMEQERLLLKEQELQKQREAAAKERELKQMINNHNKSVMTQKQHQTSQSTTSVMNTTQTLNQSKTMGNSNSYEMTPVKKACLGKNANNYDIEDRNSDDSSDDEEAPKKKIPEWAMGVNLSTALIKQFSNPPDLQAIFQFCFAPPNLEEIFGGMRKRRYRERTSSAIWNTPPMKYC